MLLFYAPDITSSVYALSSEESRHCVKAMRLKKGDKIYLTDGKGNRHEAIIIDNHIQKCLVEISQIVKIENEFSYHIHMAVAPTKNTDRYEWFVEKATEIGISEITPLLCSNSEKTRINTSRIERIQIAAMKQSLRCVLPTLNPESNYINLIENAKETQKFIAYCGNTSQPTPLLQHVCKKNTDTLILIGPEGDFTPEEVTTAIQQGFTPISLGKSRLRTETAAVVACHTLHVANQ